MRKVIDAGALRSPLLGDFLNASPQNFAIITDYAGFESFQGDANSNVRRSLKILSQYPNQVLLLKNTPAISALRPKGKGLQSRLIDYQQTAGFGKYCEQIYNAPASSAVLRDMISKQKTANDFREFLTGNAEKLRAGINELAEHHDPEDLRALRSGRRPTSRFTETVTRDILMLTATLFRNGGKHSKLPESKEVLFSFHFAIRSAVISSPQIGWQKEDTNHGQFLKLRTTL